MAMIATGKGNGFYSGTTFVFMRVALTHLLDAAHSVLLILVIVIGVIPHQPANRNTGPSAWMPPSSSRASSRVVYCSHRFGFGERTKPNSWIYARSLRAKAATNSDERQKPQQIDEIAQEISWAVKQPRKSETASGKRERPRDGNCSI